jgi:isoleucyl-tRNA synthetase
VRWLAPILSFTADEIWQYIPGARSESVFLSVWYEGLAPLPAGEPCDAAFWERLIAVREAVAKELEQLRIAGEIGSSLDAEVDLYADDAWFATLAALEDELRFALITSYARVHPEGARPAGANACVLPGLWILASASRHPKCARCWHHREDVGSDPQHPDICGRCVENVMGDGEERRYA